MKITIETKGTIGIVKIDGEVVPNVIAYKVEHSARDIPLVTLTLFPNHLEMEMDAVEAVEQQFRITADEAEHVETTRSDPMDIVRRMVR